MKVAGLAVMLGVGVLVGWTACVVAAFAMSKGDLGIGVIEFDTDGAE